ncbi:solute carrier family 41 member 3 isoform X4 [Bubalus kerabau]|uniref:solute carrier family 41 member 3 isoform X4 n=1 Tax=Bubalus carabanensis TaxID=3119969 RepID=UPI00244E6E4E|nr:solute carrier family 41 member 3 isoform X4 [Bubalus carabanensis]
MPRPPERFRDEPAGTGGPLRPSPGSTGSPRPPRPSPSPPPRWAGLGARVPRTRRHRSRRGKALCGPALPQLPPRGPILPQPPPESWSARPAGRHRTRGTLDWGGGSGLGLSGAGILLHYFQHWPVFTEMKDLLTLVPPLVGLKGNLEMTLASRLSTAANTGQIDDPREQYRVVSSNLALVQVQAAVVGLLAAVAALLLGLASGQRLDVVEAQVLCGSSVLTASLAACALGTLMVCIVVGARKLGVNPDNIATPIAASLGDLITLSLLAVVSSFFYRHREPARREDSQVRLVPHRPGDARQQPRGAHLEQDPVPAAVQRHGSLCSHHVWCWWQPGGHSDQPHLHASSPVGHARGPAPLDEKVLAQPLLHVLQLRNQRHVGPRPAGARGARPPGLLLHRLPAGEPVGPEREDLCAPVPAGGPGPGDRPAAPG